MYQIEVCGKCIYANDELGDDIETQISLLPKVMASYTRLVFIADDGKRFIVKSDLAHMMSDAVLYCITTHDNLNGINIVVTTFETWNVIQAYTHAIGVRIYAISSKHIHKIIPPV